MLHALEELSRDPAALLEAVEAADARSARNRGAEDDGRLVLTRTNTDEFETITYHAVKTTARQSEITGDTVLEYGDQPVEIETRLYNRAKLEKTVVPPAAYLVPAQWREVIDRLRRHGVEFFRLEQTERLEVETYRFEDIIFAERPFEGRCQPNYTTVAEHETREFRAGTVVVPMDQRRARVAAHLLEPEAPDSLLAWGFFNAIFEQKEYAESYVMEPIARQMLESDPALKEEFERKLREDQEFAADAWARLNFFYSRSPYWDELKDVYPVCRLMDAEELSRLRSAGR